MSIPNPPQGMDAFGEWFSEVFRLWSARWQVWTVQGLILFVVTVLPAVIWYVVTMGSIIATGVRNPSASPDDTTFLTMMGGMYGLLILGGIIALFLLPGMVNTALKQIRGEEIAVSDLFSGAGYAGGYFVILLLVSLGTLACCVGSIAVSALLFLALPLMIDRGLSIGAALSLSWETTKRNFWLYLLFSFVVGLLVSAGGAVCYVGYIITYAFYPLAVAVAYSRTFQPWSPVQGFGKPGGNMPPPPPPPYSPGQ